MKSRKPTKLEKVLREHTVVVVAVAYLVSRMVDVTYMTDMMRVVITPGTAGDEGSCVRVEAGWVVVEFPDRV